MAYQMVKARTWKAFLQELAQYDVQLKQSEHALTSPDGEAEHIPYLEREYGIETYRYVVQKLPDDQPLMPSVIRSICQALHLDLAEFGFDVEGPNPED